MRTIKKIALCLNAFSLCCALVHAQSTSTQPATLPSTQPAGVPTADVVIAPFTFIGGENALDWAGRAVQQNLISDLAHNKLRPKATDQSITNTADALTAARNSGAKFLITGTYQTAEQSLRFDGQIIDASTGNIVGGMSATGAPRDLFSLEDYLSTQALQQLNQPTLAVANKNLAHPAPPAPIPAALQPNVIVQLIQPPAVAQAGTVSPYQGSALQHYVDANRTPSTDFHQQVQDAQYRDTFSSFNNYGYGLGYGYGFGFGLGYTSFSSPFVGCYSPGLNFSGGSIGYTGGSLHGHHPHIVNADR